MHTRQAPTDRPDSVYITLHFVYIYIKYSFAKIRRRLIWSWQQKNNCSYFLFYFQMSELFTIHAAFSLHLRVPLVSNLLRNDFVFYSDDLKINIAWDSGVCLTFSKCSLYLSLSGYLTWAQTKIKNTPLEITQTTQFMFTYHVCSNKSRKPYSVVCFGYAVLAFSCIPFICKELLRLYISASTKI